MNRFIKTYLQFVKSFEKEEWYFFPQPLVPRTITVDIFTGGGEVKISLKNKTKSIAPQRKKGKHLLLMKILYIRWIDDIANVLSESKIGMRIE